jgi:hypothetical protein
MQGNAKVGSGGLEKIVSVKSSTLIDAAWGKQGNNFWIRSQPVQWDNKVILPSDYQSSRHNG